METGRWEEEVVDVTKVTRTVLNSCDIALGTNVNSRLLLLLPLLILMLQYEYLL